MSYQAYLPSLIKRENILTENSRLALTESIAQVAGPGIAGTLVQLITAPMAMLFDATSFVCSAISVLLIRKVEPAPTRTLEPHIGREISEGLGASWRDPLLRALAVRKATSAFFLGFGSSLYFLFATRELGLTAALLGIIIAIGGTSGLFGAFLTEWLVRRFGFGRTFIGSAVVIGIAMLLIPLAHGSAAICSAFLIASQLGDLAWPVYTISERSLLAMGVRQSAANRCNRSSTFDDVAGSLPSTPTARIPARREGNKGMSTIPERKLTQPLSHAGSRKDTTLWGIIVLIWRTPATQGQPSLHSGSAAPLSQFLCDTDQCRAQSERHRRFAPTSLIGHRENGDWDHWRPVIDFRRIRNQIQRKIDLASSRWFRWTL